MDFIDEKGLSVNLTGHDSFRQTSAIRITLIWEYHISICGKSDCTICPEVTNEF